MKIGLAILAIIVGLLLLLELGLRLVFGFGNPLIYIADEQIGYLLAPNQRTRRFGNRIEINQYSMRSHAVSKERSHSTLRVLLLGDSIANGGWWTDRANIISATIAGQLESAASDIGFKEVEVLNASANSWGPRNELAYVERFGTFDAQVLVLLINTDDLFATAPTSLPVGRDRNYPNRKPPLALAEVFNRYLLPAPKLAAVNGEESDRVDRNLAAIEQIGLLAHQSNCHFLLAMTPLLREIGNSGPRDYELKERQRLTDFTQSQQILYLDFLPIFNRAQQPETLYRDHIHLSPQGNHLVSEAISREILDFRLQISNLFGIDNFKSEI
ncbi:SGNH/GDSL hydrolase family protein [Argonema galeatum]|uniref:SGNH/GDSL hydrolase family protein n=1 Tax=Argonema galeatum TaxID=2942762 RepID=UPI00201127E1|nr:SGNH/GDSL hydrolase family protein [Argonema galeatum]MCL1465292.1 SGNH/GDSL hydrolase family protein [Argonema galeatum A003/A1]